MTTKITGKRVTTLDIAKLAGVSKAAVSYALNGTGSVSPEVTKKIHEIASQLGYKPNRLAAATRTGRTNTIGLVLPDLTNPFFPALAQSVQSAAHQHGYSVFLVDPQNSADEELKGIERLEEHSIDGLIWCPLDDNSALKGKHSFPIVIIDRPLKGFDSVFADSFKGGQLQGEYLLQNGHREIGILSGPDRSPSARERRKGLLSVVKRHCDIHWDFQLEYSLTIPADVQTQILASKPSCVVAANDTLAVALLRLYHQSGISVPNDVSIIGFDDIDWANLVTPPLTTIKISTGDMGQASFDLLLERINNPSAKIKRKILDVETVERESFRELSS